MDLTPSQVTGASFRTVRKGFDPDEVNAFLEQAASALEAAQQQKTAMEARARAAYSKIQDLTASAEKSKQADADTVPSDEAETISRTLLLAQRTADATMAEARAEADRLVSEARTESETTLDSTREMSAQLLEEARSEARKATEAERETAENEVQALVARRDFLSGDVETLERFVSEQRDRLRAAAAEIAALADRAPDGLGEVNAPAISASGDELGESTAELERPDTLFDDDDDIDDDDRDGDDPVGSDDVADQPTEAIDIVGDDAGSDEATDDEMVDPTPRAATPPTGSFNNPSTD